MGEFFPTRKKKEIFKIHLFVLKNLESQLSVTVHHMRVNYILANTINRAIIILFLLGDEVDFSTFWLSYYIIKKHI